MIRDSYFFDSCQNCYRNHMLTANCIMCMRVSILYETIAIFDVFFLNALLLLFIKTKQVRGLFITGKLDLRDLLF